VNNSNFNKYLEIIQEMKVIYDLKDNIKRIIGMMKDYFNYNQKINILDISEIDSQKFKNVLLNKDNWVESKICYIVFIVKYKNNISFYKLSSIKIPKNNDDLVNNKYQSLEVIKINNKDIDKIIIIPNENIENNKILNELSFNEFFEHI
jgi:hypothetical protein